MYMDSGASSASVTVRRQTQDKTRRTWNARGEDVLVQELKDEITKGWKNENIFKTGYLNLLENAMQAAIPGNNLRGNPHINSNIHVWKKSYSSLVTLLAKSGVGWNDPNRTIDVTDETWKDIVKNDPMLRSMRHKQWTHYHEWCDIFGNDRDTVDRSVNFENALHAVLNLENEIPTDTSLGETTMCKPVEVAEDSISDTHTPVSKRKEQTTSKSKKRKQSAEANQRIFAAIKNLADITQETMADLIKHLAAEDTLSNAQDQGL